MNLLSQAIVVGILAILFGWLASMLVRPFFKVSLPEICKRWNKHHVMEVTLFFTGFIGYLITTLVLRR